MNELFQENERKITELRRLSHFTNSGRLSNGCLLIIVILLMIPLIITVNTGELKWVILTIASIPFSFILNLTMDNYVKKANSNKMVQPHLLKKILSRKTEEYLLGDLKMTGSYLSEGHLFNTLHSLEKAQLVTDNNRNIANKKAREKARKIQADRDFWNEMTRGKK